jgi:carboxypeptidase family protein
VAVVIRGMVQDEDGQVLAGARVHFTASPVPLPDIATLTGADGAFALGVPAVGDYELGVDADGFEPWRRRLQVAGGVPVDVTVRLRRRA